jgi:hypothetical protein
MGQRRVNLTHPQPEAVAETVRQDKTSFSGAAAFMAREGAFTFAADRDGLGGVFERVWLRPSAARRLAGFLDLRPPGVIGYRVAVDSDAPPQLMARAHPLAALQATLQSVQGATLDGERQLCVAACADHGGVWPIEATLTYQHHFKLSGGQWSIDQPVVCLRAQADGEHALLAAIVSRREDVAQVRRVAAELERRSDGLILEEIALPEEAALRHRDLRAVLAALGDPVRVRVGNFQSRERERKAAEPAADEWAASNEAAAYRMRPHTVEAMLKRIEEVDDASFASGVAFLPDTSGLTVAVTLRQNSGRDEHLGLFFYGARHRDEPEPPLTKDAWEDARPVDWDDRRKGMEVLTLWATAARALLASAERRTQVAGGDAGQAAA